MPLALAFQNFMPWAFKKLEILKIMQRFKNYQ